MLRHKNLVKAFIWVVFSLSLHNHSMSFYVSFWFQISITGIRLINDDNLVQFTLQKWKSFYFGLWASLYEYFNNNCFLVYAPYAYFLVLYDHIIRKKLTYQSLMTESFQIFHFPLACLFAFGSRFIKDLACCGFSSSMAHICCDWKASLA